MGLDMYLRGSHYNSEHSHKGDIKRPMLENKYNISDYNIEFGYWRKHPDLHGYIVKEFAKGEDDCQNIPLTETDIDKIIMAIRDDKLLKDHSGFFFGNSTQNEYYKPEEKTYAINCFEKAKQFLIDGKRIYKDQELFIHPREVHYRASW